MQARERLARVAPWPGPEDLSRRRRARPDNRIKVLRTGLLGPEQLLTPKDEVCLRLGDVGLGVERVRLGQR